MEEAPSSDMTLASVTVPANLLGRGIVRRREISKMRKYLKLHEQCRVLV